MNEKEFRQYVNEQKLQGRSESQIARSLGMSLAHFMGRLNGVDVEKVDPPKQKVDTPKSEKKSEVKPVSGAKQPEKHEKPKKEKVTEVPKTEEKVEEAKEEKPVEDLSWME